MRPVLLALVLLAAIPRAGAAQSVDALRAGPSLSSAHAERASSPPAPSADCDYSWKERALGGALIGGAIGAGAGYVMSILTLSSPEQRRGAMWKLGAVGAGTGAVMGATVSCRPGRPSSPPRPRWPRPVR